MNPLRVALVIPRADRPGGAEWYTRRLAAALCEAGIEARVLSAGHHEETPTEQRVTLRIGRGSRRHWYEEFVDEAQRAATGFDIVHAMMPLRRCDVYQPHAGLAAAGPAGLLPKSPRVAHVLSGKRRLSVQLERAMFANGRQPRLFGLSPAMCTLAGRLLGARQCEPLGAAIDFNEFHGQVVGRAAAKKTAGPTRFLFVAYNFRIKGLSAALDAAAAAGGTLTVAGGGPAGSFAKHPLARAGRVRFVGPVEDARPLYAQADALLAPTWRDTFGLSVVEAAAAGVPSAVSPLAGVSSWFVDGENALIPGKPDESAAWAEAARQLTCPAERLRLATAATDVARQFDFADHARKVLALYRNGR